MRENVSGGVKMFSVPAIKKVYCHVTELAYCQYVNYSEVAFSQ